MVPPVGARGHLRRQPPGAEAGQLRVGRQPRRDRAHLHHAEHHEGDGEPPPDALGQRLEAESGQHRQRAEDRQRVAQVLVPDDLQHEERRERGDQQKPLAADHGDHEADGGQQHGGDAELIAEVLQIEDQAGPRERVGMAGLGGLGERARVDLGAEAEQARAEPRQRERGRDQRGQRGARQPAAAAADDDHQRGRQHVERERRLRQHAESAHDADGQRGAEPREVLGGHQRGQRERHHRRQRQVELEQQRRVHDERRGAEEQCRRHAGPAHAEPIAQQVHRHHADRQEHEERGGPGRLRRQHERQRASRARRQRRVERGALENRADVAGPEIARAEQRALEVVGVVPLRGTPIHGDPGGGHEGEHEPAEADHRQLPPHRRTRLRLRAARECARRGCPAARSSS